MHDSVKDWIGRRCWKYDLRNAPVVIEIGSADVNGSVRDFFDKSFLGLDIVEGQGVDVVYDGHHIPLDDGYADVVVSTEALEHVDKPWVLLAEMARVLKDGGHLLLTCRGFDTDRSFPEHCAPDYWRFGRPAMKMLLRDAGFHGELDSDPEEAGWFVHARKVSSIG